MDKKYNPRISLQFGRVELGSTGHLKNRWFNSGISARELLILFTKIKL